MTAPTVLNVILCDFVTQEVTGKFTCVGIYPAAAVGLPAFPGAVTVSFYMEVVGRAAGAVSGMFQIRQHGDAQALATDIFSFNSEPDIRMSLFTRPIRFIAPAPGDYAFEWLIDGRWAEITRFRIISL